MSPSLVPSPSHVAPDELAPEVEETIQSLGTQVPIPLEPEITRLPTPCPVREPYDAGSPNVVHMFVSPERFNEAPMTTEQSTVELRSLLLSPLYMNCSTGMLKRLMICKWSLQTPNLHLVVRLCC